VRTHLMLSHQLTLASLTLSLDRHDYVVAGAIPSSNFDVFVAALD